MSAHATGCVNQYDDLRPTFAIEGEPQLRQQHEEGQKDRGYSQEKGNEQAPVADDGTPFKSIQKERQTNAQHRKRDDEALIVGSVPHKRSESFQPPLRPFARLRGGHPRRHFELVALVLGQEAEEVTGSFVMDEDEERAPGCGQRKNGRRGANDADIPPSIDRPRRSIQVARACGSRWAPSPGQ